MTTNENPIWSRVDAKREAFVGLSDRVFDMPEIAYTEVRSCAEHTAMLRAEGFRVTERVAGIPTAVMGEAGEGGPIIAILGEYDALPGLSQQPGLAMPKMIDPSGQGHGCGHNLLGSAAMLAATAIKDWLAAEGIKGRVRYFGCPAEEGGAAKTYMVRDGWFDDVDLAITWHPGSFNAVDDARSLANTRIDFTFTGKAAHAAAAPELGRSALDAVELMNIGVNYMREHMPDDARVHYAYLDAGGSAPNVVQAKATVRQLIRARDLKGLSDLVARVRAIADGAALMSGTKVESHVFSAVSNLLGNRPLEEAMQTEFEALGPVPFDATDVEFANEIRKTLTPEDIADAFRRLSMKPQMDKPLCDFIAPLDRPFGGGMGSTDVGDVSWAVPTVQARVATAAMGTPLHTWQQTAQGKAPFAHKGMVHAAKVMAATARAAILSETLRAAARKAHQEHLAEFPYACPIPVTTKPPIAAE
ncbi:M20 family metallopeptidase [Seohaeicola sp. SP36]|uniref:M20 family metallopeptidase n=1 Tax=unclassified Seohaeicola TaxID=2641111 RepID=UPI00237AB55D|nr:MULTISPECIES: M20 family metallopeptidase [unclassified Seohaeicola]MDD9707756.1 M20 family metallopeptidase [Seohaeicola sp. 4SK31]MDD9735998.1 M20 family metallopeptidase [Seohaeicola sp. SP36]